MTTATATATTRTTALTATNETTHGDGEDVDRARWTRPAPGMGPIAVAAADDAAGKGGDCRAV